MKLFFKFLIIFLSITVIIGCKISKRDTYLIQQLMHKGYEKGNIGYFDYNYSMFQTLDTIEHTYYQKYYEGNKNKIRKEVFLNIPNVKDSIKFWVSFPGVTFRKNSDSRIDTIDIFIDNKLFNTGRYPYKLQDRYNYPNLPQRANFTYLNRIKQKEIAITIVFHNDKIYFDTIIPLRFREVHVYYDTNHTISFGFEKAVSLK